MNYAAELAATRAVLDQPFIGASQVNEIETLRRLVAKYPDEARRALSKAETP